MVNAEFCPIQLSTGLQRAVHCSSAVGNYLQARLNFEESSSPKGFRHSRAPAQYLLDWRSAAADRQCG